MKKTQYKITSLIMAILLVVSIVCLSACSAGEDEEELAQELIFAVGSKNTTSSVYGKAIVSWLKECYSDNEEIVFKTKANSNELTNMRKLISGDVAFAIIPGDLVSYAKSGTVYFDAAADHITPIAELCSMGYQLIASKQSQIATLSDLKGKTIAIGDEGSETSLMYEKVAEACGIGEEVETVFMPYGESVEALEAGEIDAVFAAGDAPLKKLLELSVNNGIKLVDIGEDVCKALAEEYDYMMSITVPAATYQGQEEDVHTIGVKIYLLKNDDLISDDFGSEVLSKIEEGLETITESCEKASEFKPLF